MKNRSSRIDNILKYAKRENGIQVFVCYVKENRQDGNHIYCDEHGEVITLDESPNRINICICDENTEGQRPFRI